MDVLILSNDINYNVQPQYINRAIKSDTYVVYHIYDLRTCEMNIQAIGCFGDVHTDEDIKKFPLSYNASFALNYDLNYLLDQDGNKDDKCTAAFISKINISESFSYPDCMKDVNFDNFLYLLLGKIGNDQVGAIASIVMQVINSATINYNTVYKTLDIGSGTYNYQKSIKRELFQYRRESLLGNSIIEGFTIECTKDPGGYNIKMKAKIITIDVDLKKVDTNIDSISLQVKC